jgi:hypothetical protein
MAVRVTLIGVGVARQAWRFRRCGDRAGTPGLAQRNRCAVDCAARSRPSTSDAEAIKPRRDMTGWRNGPAIHVLSGDLGETGAPEPAMLISGRGL